MSRLPTSEPIGRGGISLNKKTDPIRGEIWYIDFDPTVGAEIRKMRPAVVISSDGIGNLPIKLVAPVTEWKNAFAGKSWLVRIDPDSRNRLAKTSAADILQIRGVDLRRFANRLGHISPAVLDEIAAAVAIVVESP